MLPAAAAPAQPAAEAEADATTGAEMKTVAWAALASYESLLGDLDYLGELADRPGMGDMVRGLIPMFLQGRDLRALGMDTDRPIGVVLQTDGQQFVPMACLPVTDLDAMLEVVEGFGFPPADLGDGVMELELPDQTIYMQTIGDWTYVAQSPDAFDVAPDDPSAALNALVAKYDLSVTMAVQNVPAVYRELALQQLQQGMEQGLVQQDGETDEDFETRTRLAEMQVAQISDAIESVDRLTAGWSIDADAGSTYLDVAFTVLEGSKLAPAVATYQDTTTRLAGFHKPDAAASFLASGTTPPEILEEQREQLEATVEMLRTQVTKAADDAEEIEDEQTRTALKEIALTLFDVYEEMILSGKAEIGGSMDLGGDGVGVIGALVVPDPSKVEDAVRRLGDLAANYEGEGEAPVFDFDYGSHAGVTLHRMSATVPDEGRAREMLGDELVVTIGVGPDAVYFAVGADGEAALKGALDESRSRDGEEILPFELVVSAKQVVDFALRFADEDSVETLNMVADSMEDIEAGEDQLRISGRPIPNGIIIRYEIQEGVLRAAAKAGVAAQQAAMGGGF